MQGNEKASNEREQIAQKDLCDFLCEIAKLILPTYESEWLHEKQESNEPIRGMLATLNIIVDGKCVFGIPIGRGSSDKKELLELISGCKKLINEYHR